MLQFKKGDRVRLKGTKHAYFENQRIRIKDAKKEFNLWRNTQKGKDVLNKGSIVTITTVETDEKGYKHYWINNINYGKFSDEDFEPLKPSRFDEIDQQLNKVTK